MNASMTKEHQNTLQLISSWEEQYEEFLVAEINGEVGKVRKVIGQNLQDIICSLFIKA